MHKNPYLDPILRPEGVLTDLDPPLSGRTATNTKKKSRTIKSPPRMNNDFLPQTQLYY